MTEQLTYKLDKITDGPDGSDLGKLSGLGILENNIEVRKVKGFLEYKIVTFSQLLKSNSDPTVFISYSSGPYSSIVASGNLSPPGIKSSRNCII